MSATSRVAVAVAAGYLLGRTKKLRLAVTVGSMLAGSRLAGDIKPAALLQSLSGNPEVQRLQEQLRGQVLRAAKGAAMNVTTSRLEALNDSLKNRGSSEDQAEDEGDQDDEQPEDQTDQQGSSRSGGDATSKTATAKKSATKRAASKSAPAKKTAASKTGASKSAASRTGKSAAGRTSQTRSAAKKTAARAEGR